VVQSDYGYVINFSLVNIDGSVFSLVDATGLTLRVQKTNQVQVNFSGAMVVVSDVGGTCSYQVAQGNFNLAGYYNAQIQVSFIGEVVTFPNIQILAVAKVPA